MNCSNQLCSSTCKDWVFRKRPKPPLTPPGQMPNVNVVNIYIYWRPPTGGPHVRRDGETGRDAQGRLDRAGGARLHRLLAGRPRPSDLPEMEWTHVVLEVWPLR